jgi:flagellar hook-length control protein FliK
VLRVTSETAGTGPGQLSPPKPARADLPPESTTFASLIGNIGTAPANTDRAAATRDQPRRRDDDAPSQNPVTPDASARGSHAPANSPDDEGDIVGRDDTGPSNDSMASTTPVSGDSAKIEMLNTEAAGVSDCAGSGDVTIDTLATTALAPAAVAVAVSGTIPALPVVTQAPLSIAAAAINASLTSEGTPAPSSTANPTPESAASTARAVVAPSIGAVNSVGANIALSSGAGDATATSMALQNGASAIAPGASVSSGVARPVVARAGFNSTAATRPSTGAAASTTDSSAASDALQTPAGLLSLNGIDPQAQAPLGDRLDSSAQSIAGQQDAANPNTLQPLAASHQHGVATSPDQTHADLSASGNPAANVPQPPAQPAHVAVNQLSVAAATTAAVPVNALALQIAVTAQSGNSRFEIRLDPAELGRIEVRIDIDRHGQVTSHLTVEKPETLAMLRQDAPHLQRALDDAGFKTGNSGLQFSLRDQSSSGQNNGNESGSQAQRLIISEDDAVAAITAGHTYGRMLASGSGVDIRV